MRKLSCIAIGFTAAIFIAMYALGEHVVVLASIAGTISVLFFISSLKRYKAIRLAVSVLFAGFLWWILYQSLFYLPAVSLRESEQMASFTVLDFPDHYTYSSRVFVRTEKGFKANLKLQDRIELKPGDTITLPVLFTAPTETRDFDFLTYYRAKGIFLDATQQGPAEVVSTERISIWHWPVLARHAIMQKLDLLFTGDEKGLVGALLTGDRSGISQPFQFSLSISGMSHIISVSGMHVSFVVSMILKLFRKRWIAAVLGIPLMIFFVLMTGAAPSAIRACVMQTILLTAGVLNREEDALTSLSAALLLLMMLNPFSIADIGLQLSFLATLGLILFSPRISIRLNAKLPKKLRGNPVIRFIVSTIAATLSASVLTSLPVAYYFGRFSLVAPLSNLASLWVVSAVFFGGILCVVLSYFWLPIAQLIAVPVSYGLKYMKLAADYSTALPFSSLDINNPFLQIWIVFVLLLLGLRLIIGKNKLRPVVVCCVVGSTLASALLFSELLLSSAELRIGVLDVGQGQSIVATSGAYTALVDCGGDRYPGAGIITIDYLKSRNRKQIDLLMLTHTHSDHVNGLQDLMKHVKIKYAAVPDTRASDEIAELLTEHGVEVLRISRNHLVEMGNSSIRLFRPIVKKSGDEEAMCILLQAGNFEALITGDSALISERILLEREALPNIDLLVAGHHGSKESSGELLLETVKPEIAVISVGANSYGHPAPETVQRLQKRGIRIYRTDMQGAIEIDVKG